MIKQKLLPFIQVRVLREEITPRKRVCYMIKRVNFLILSSKQEILLHLLPEIP